jgi:hypothetical protein
MAGIFIVHTNEYDRLRECYWKSMYGVSKEGFVEMPVKLRNISEGDIVFISERIKYNVLMGPFYVVKKHSNIAQKKVYGYWVEVDSKKSKSDDLAYWAKYGPFVYCIFFDKLLRNEISIVWPNKWRHLNVQLPSWGNVNDNDARILLDYATKNYEDPAEFFRKHDHP